jgi:hypothetical protein
MIKAGVISSKALHGRVLFGKLSRKRLNTVCNPLKLVLLLACYLAPRHSRVVILVAPLNFHSVEINLGVEAIDVLAGVRGEASECRDQ